jgi:hypothetical protein
VWVGRRPTVIPSHSAAVCPSQLPRGAWMNRYMNRYVLALVLFVSLDTQAFAQVKLEGEKEATVGNLNKVAVKIEKGKDLKIQLLKDGEPTASEHMVVKELDDSVAVLLFPPVPKKGQPTSWTYTVVAAVNSDGKTHTAFHVAKVGKSNPLPEPKTPEEDDEPTPAKLTEIQKDLEDLYKAAPDSVSKDKLIAAFTEVKLKVPSLKSFGDYETEIAASVTKQLPERTKLRTIRVRISSFLVEKTGEDPRRWDAKVATDTCDEVIEALRRLQ